MKPVRLRAAHAPVARAAPRAAPAFPLRLLATVPHRMFFAQAMALLLVAVLGWAWTMAARAGWVAGPTTGAAQPSWHLLAMLYGFLPFFMFGFLFTAGPRWLDVPAPRPALWRPAGVAALAGAATMLLAPGEALARAGAAVHGVAWLALAAAFARLFAASRVRDRGHAGVVLAAMLAGASGPLAYAASGDAAYPWLAFAGLWLFAVPVFVAVCHRMIPFFTANVLPTIAIFRPWWLLAALLGGPLAHGTLEAAGARGWTWIVDVPLALLALDLARRWGLAQSFANRLLAMLHVGFVWYGVAFALYAVSSLTTLADRGALGSAPAHALALGYCGSLMLAMVSRVTFGHAGRTLAADRLTWALFLLLQATVVVRVAAALWPAPWLLAFAALLWALCAAPWALRNLPIYARARRDGRAG